LEFLLSRRTSFVEWSDPFFDIEAFREANERVFVEKIGGKWWKEGEREELLRIL
jgi:hypothetical protein